MTGFRLDSDVFACFRLQLRERGMAMQPTLEGWVKEWLLANQPHPDAVLAEIRKNQMELMKSAEELLRSRGRSDRDA